MTRKTVSLDADVYRQIRNRQAPHESISATLRWVLEEEKDPADYLDELFSEFGGKGAMTDSGLAGARLRQGHSRVPVVRRGADAATRYSL